MLVTRLRKERKIDGDKKGKIKERGKVALW